MVGVGREFPRPAGRDGGDDTDEAGGKPARGGVPGRAVTAGVLPGGVGIMRNFYENVMMLHFVFLMLIAESHYLAITFQRTISAILVHVCNPKTILPSAL
jgi:hypothetical protein